VWGKVKLAFMKFPMMLQASSSTQAHRRHLKAYAKIGLSEHGKVETWRLFRLRSVVQERKKTITVLYSTESDGIVPMKL
jgi:hypothetical protein